MIRLGAPCIAALLCAGCGQSGVEATCQNAVGCFGTTLVGTEAQCESQQNACISAMETAGSACDGFINDYETLLACQGGLSCMTLEGDLVEDLIVFNTALDGGMADAGFAFSSCTAEFQSLVADLSSSTLPCIAGCESALPDAGGF